MNSFCNVRRQELLDNGVDNRLESRWGVDSEHEMAVHETCRIVYGYVLLRYRNTTTYRVRCRCRARRIRRRVRSRCRGCAQRENPFLSCPISTTPRPLRTVQTRHSALTSFVYEQRANGCPRTGRRIRHPCRNDAKPHRWHVCAWRADRNRVPTQRLVVLGDVVHCEGGIDLDRRRTRRGPYAAGFAADLLGNVLRGHRNRSAHAKRKTAALQFIPEPKRTNPYRRSPGKPFAMFVSQL